MRKLYKITKGYFTYYVEANSVEKALELFNQQLQDNFEMEASIIERDKLKASIVGESVSIIHITDFIYPIN